MSEKLERVDVTDCAEDDNELKRIFKEKTRRTDCDVGPWTPGNPPTARGPYGHTTALVVKHNSGDGTVKIFLGNRNVDTIQTNPDSEKGVEMIVLEHGYYCWWMLDAEVKFIA